MTGYAQFNGDASGDASVGDSPRSYDFEIPDFDEEYREEVRARLVEAYNWLDGDGTCFVVFEGERDEDPPEAEPPVPGDWWLSR